MSDLRGQLIAALPNLGLGRTDWEGEQTVDALMPIIEAELQKRDREIERLKQAWGVAEMLRAEDADRKGQEQVERLNPDYGYQEDVDMFEALTEANQLLEQTIEVLEGAPEGPDFAYNPLWWLSWFDENCQPLLDKLQALKKEGTE